MPFLLIFNLHATALMLIAGAVHAFVVNNTFIFYSINTIPIPAAVLWIQIRKDPHYFGNLDQHK
jgi:hypothetical protein